MYSTFWYDPRLKSSLKGVMVYPKLTIEGGNMMINLFVRQVIWEYPIFERYKLGLSDKL